MFIDISRDQSSLVSPGFSFLHDLHSNKRDPNAQANVADSSILQNSILKSSLDYPQSSDLKISGREKARSSSRFMLNIKPVLSTKHYLKHETVISSSDGTFRSKTPPISNRFLTRYNSHLKRSRIMPTSQLPDANLLRYGSKLVIQSPLTYKCIRNENEKKSFFIKNSINKPKPQSVSPSHSLVKIKLEKIAKPRGEIENPSEREIRPTSHTTGLRVPISPYLLPPNASIDNLFKMEYTEDDQTIKERQKTITSMKEGNSQPYRIDTNYDLEDILKNNSAFMQYFKERVSMNCAGKKNIIYSFSQKKRSYKLPQNK